MVYAADNSSVATLMPTNSSAVTALNNIIVADNGIYNFTYVQINTKPGSPASLSLQIAGMETFGNSLDFVNIPTSIQIQTRTGEQGEAMTADGKCEICP